MQQSDAVLVWLQIAEFDQRGQFEAGRVARVAALVYKVARLADVQKHGGQVEAGMHGLGRFEYAAKHLAKIRRLIGELLFEEQALNSQLIT